MAAQRASQPDSLRMGGSFARYLVAAQARLSAIRDRNPRPIESDAEPSAFTYIMSAAFAYRTGSMHAVLDGAARALDHDASPRIQSASHLLSAAARLTLGRLDAAAKSFTTAHAVIEIERLYSSYSMIAPAHLLELSASTGLSVPLVRRRDRPVGRDRSGPRCAVPTRATGADPPRIRPLDASHRRHSLREQEHDQDDDEQPLSKTGRQLETGRCRYRSPRGPRIDRAIGGGFDARAHRVHRSIRLTGDRFRRHIRLRRPPRGRPREQPARAVTARRHPRRGAADGLHLGLSHDAGLRAEPHRGIRRRVSGLQPPRAQHDRRRSDAAALHRPRPGIARVSRGRAASGRSHREDDSWRASPTRSASW